MMQAIPESTCQAVRRAYEGVMEQVARDETRAFEAGVTVYRRLHPDTTELLARDRVAQVIADSISQAGLEWINARYSF